MGFHFGVGYLFATQTNDATGAAVSNPTPIQFGTLQEVNVDMSFDSKPLYGQKQFPLAVGRGKGKLMAKAKLADIDGKILSALVFGQAYSQGIKSLAPNVPGAIPSSPGPYTITPAVPSSGTWVADLGVLSVSTGLPFTRVASTPTTGQYSVAGGVYTFAAADADVGVLISFEYEKTGTAGTYGTISNQNMGYSPFFSVALSNTYDGKETMLKFNRAMSSKFSFPFKNEDFAVPDFEFEMFADGAGNIGYWSQK